MCTGRGSNQGPLGPKSDTLTTAPLRHMLSENFARCNNVRLLFKMLGFNVDIKSECKRNDVMKGKKEKKTYYQH